VLTSSDFITLLSAVAPFAQPWKSGGKDACKSVLFEFSPESLRLVATDGYILAAGEISGAFGFSGSFPVRITDVDEITRLFNGGPEIILMLIASESGVSLTDGKVTFNAEVLEDVYPDYRPAIENALIESHGCVRLDSDFVARIIKSSAKISGKKGHVDITTRGETSLVTFVPLIDGAFKTVTSLVYHVMPRRRV